MLGRHLAIGLCALLLGDAALLAAPSSGPDVQPSDYLSRAEQLALIEPSWPRWLSTTDF